MKGKENKSQKEAYDLMSSLSLVERETIIIYNEAEQTATVSTTNQALINRLEAFSEEFDEVVFIKNDRFGAEYEIPKKLVTIRKPIVISEKEKKARAERMMRMNEDKNT